MLLSIRLILSEHDHLGLKNRNWSLDGMLPSQFGLKFMLNQVAMQIFVNIQLFEYWLQKYNAFDQHSIFDKKNDFLSVLQIYVHILGNEKLFFFCEINEHSGWY